MPRRLRVRPTLELLEDRAVPATVRFVAGTLLISNPTITGSSTSPTVAQDPATANRFTVKDGVVSNGTYCRPRRHPGGADRRRQVRQHRRLPQRPERQNQHQRHG